MYKRYAACASNARQARVVILKMPVVLTEFHGSYAYMYALTLIALLILRSSKQCVLCVVPPRDKMAIFLPAILIAEV